ncbi:caffeic acid 3-O-methyltransferase-like [Dendrobium catenatum]|uniref:caffeic acid 3-O-methyltransferase-like n=1 Tax=Dendrobium catenatum TaxID=906689 RepID=UPI00109F3F4C|nr:caffeic acid 3-O-methyltransferase-like [Dendrobium catenatum]
MPSKVNVCYLVGGADVRDVYCAGLDMFTDEIVVNFNLWILHDWTDEQCMKLLRNCWKALPEKGKMIVVECILPVVPNEAIATKGGFQIDLAMFVVTPRGKERMENEFKSLAKEAGFSNFKSIYIFAGSWVMEFIK